MQDAITHAENDPPTEKLSDSYLRAKLWVPPPNSNYAGTSQLSAQQQLLPAKASFTHQLPLAKVDMHTADQQATDTFARETADASVGNMGATVQKLEDIRRARAANSDEQDVRVPGSHQSKREAEN